MFQNLISATQQQEQIRIAGRRQTLAEQQFESQEIDTVAKRDAVGRLAGVKWDELHRVDPQTLATINDASLSTLLNISSKAAAGQPVDVNAPREVKLLAAMREQVGPEGDIADSDIWRVMTTGKGKEKNESEIRQALVQKAIGSPIYMTKSPAEQKQIIDQQMDAIFQEPAARTKGVSLMDRTLEQFQKQKRNEAINSLMVPSHSQ